MKRGAVVIELEHRAFGQVWAVSAGRCDTGAYLTCRNYTSKRRAPEYGWERKLLVAGPWLSPKETVEAAFNKIFAPIYQQQLRLMRRGERYDVAHRSRRGAKMPLAGNADDVHELPVELSCRDAIDDIVSVEDVEHAAALVVGGIDELLDEFQGRAHAEL